MSRLTDVHPALAYSGPPPISVARLVTGVELDPVLLVGFTVAALAYLLGVRTLSRRGDQWPPGRTVAFLGGLLIAAYAIMGGLAAYDTTLFSAHMVQHILLSMIAPIPMALGAPITLALRTLPHGHRGPRELLLAVLHSRVAAVVASPLVGFSLFTGSLFVLYFSPLYEASLRHPWFHDAVHVHFLLVGCLFYWPLLGIDPMPGRFPYWGRMLLVFVTMPVHAVLGLVLLQSERPLAQSWYQGLGRPWGTSIITDQRTGGGIMWAVGDVLGVVIVAALFVQWSRAEERGAVREDRRLDRLERVAATRVPAARGTGHVGTQRGSGDASDPRGDSREPSAVPGGTGDVADPPGDSRRDHRSQAAAETVRAPWAGLAAPGEARAQTASEHRAEQAEQHSLAAYNRYLAGLAEQHEQYERARADYYARRNAARAARRSARRTPSGR